MSAVVSHVLSPLPHPAQSPTGEGLLDKMGWEGEEGREEEPWTESQGLLPEGPRVPVGPRHAEGPQAGAETQTDTERLGAAFPAQRVCRHR